MSELNDVELPTLFDLVKTWLAKEAPDWDYAATRTDSVMQGSIWIAHYVVMHVYTDHVIVLYPYHSMCCNSTTIQAGDPNFFKELYRVLVRATHDL